MPQVKTILDELYERRAVVMHDLKVVVQQPSIYYVGDVYVADAAVASVKRARETARLMRELDRVDAQIADESEIAFGCCGVGAGDGPSLRVVAGAMAAIKAGVDHAA